MVAGHGQLVRLVSSRLAGRFTYRSTHKKKTFVDAHLRRSTHKKKKTFVDAHLRCSTHKKKKTFVDAHLRRSTHKKNRGGY
jgi:Arc/MetJ family transcription regulator